MILPRWAIALIVIYGVVAFILFCGFLCHNHTTSTSNPAPHREFSAYLGDFLIVILWPVYLVLAPPRAIIKRFLYTPGNTCFGMSCLPKEAPPAAVRSDEHNMEAGAVITAPPSAAPVEMRPVAKGAVGAPPPYDAGNVDTVTGQAA